MKTKLLIIFILFGCKSIAQTSLHKKIKPTLSVSISGLIAKSTTFGIKELEKLASEKIPDVIIYNAEGVAKDTLTNMKGITLKTLLSPIKYNYKNKHELNEFYFTLIASDGYKVVFSWNEIYNTPCGNQFYIVTEMDGKKIDKIRQRILFISTADLKTNRRYIKGLEKIEVKKTN